MHKYGKAIFSKSEAKYAIALHGFFLGNKDQNFRNVTIGKLTPIEDLGI